MAEKKKQSRVKRAMSSAKKNMTAAGKKLNDLRRQGVRRVTLYYTRDVNGKKVPNYRRVALTAAIAAAAAAGAYTYRKHKKHGHVIQKKKKDKKE